MQRSALKVAFAAGVLSCTAAAASKSEEQLGAAIEQMRAGETGEALKNLEALIRAAPDFRLGQLIYSELHVALASGTAATGVQQLVEEARLRLASETAVPPPGTLPSSIVKLAAPYRHVIVVDLPRARMYLLANKDGELTLVRHSYAAMGKNGFGKQSKGDARTPVGVYHITGWRNDDALPELYGAGAFPLSYPSPWDVFKNRTGAGIWLHGVPRNVLNRPPRSSEGCVTMANDDLLALKPYVDLGQTPVILSDALEWLPQTAVQAERDAWLARIETWRKRWESLDTTAYLNEYSSQFTTEGMNYKGFSAHKKRVNARKKFIDVKLSDVNLFHYPGAGEPLVLAEFTLDYKSDNYKTRTQKQQFWRQEKDGGWKIFREENR